MSNTADKARESVSRHAKNPKPLVERYYGVESLRREELRLLDREFLVYKIQELEMRVLASQDPENSGNYPFLNDAEDLLADLKEVIAYHESK